MRQRQNLVGARDAFRRAGLTQASAQGSNASGFHTDPGAEAHQQPAAVGAVGRRATAGAGTAVSAPRQAMRLAAQRAYAKQQSSSSGGSGGAGVAAAHEWGAAALVHAARDAAATLIQCRYRGRSVRRRWLTPAATALVHDIVGTQRLRGASLSWRVSRSQLVAKKRQLVAVLSAPPGGVAAQVGTDGRGRWDRLRGQRQPHQQVAASHPLEDGRHLEGGGYWAAANQGTAGYGYGYGYGDSTGGGRAPAGVEGQHAGDMMMMGRAALPLPQMPPPPPP